MTQEFGFTLHGTDGTARLGTVHTLHGDIRTPAFMPVGTAATVKAMTVDQVKDTGADIILASREKITLAKGSAITGTAGPESIDTLFFGTTESDNVGYHKPVTIISSATGRPLARNSAKRLATWVSACGLARGRPCAVRCAIPICMSITRSAVAIAAP